MSVSRAFWTARVTSETYLSGMPQTEGDVFWLSGRRPSSSFSRASASFMLRFKCNAWRCCSS